VPPSSPSAVGATLGKFTGVARVAAATLLAGLMAVLACQILESWDPGGARWFPSPRVLLFVVVPYMACWAVLALLVRNQTYLVAAALGVLSPVISTSFFVLVGWIVVIKLWYITFPIGIATGILVKWCMSVGR
jgi:hypothetical protein